MHDVASTRTACKVTFVSILWFLTSVGSTAFPIGIGSTRKIQSCHYDRPKSSDNLGTESTLQRRRQTRRKSVDRRPRNYWMDPENLRSELCQFWINCGVTIESKVGQVLLPTIPNEVLLMHYERHDLRAAISKNGGREAVSALLGDAPVMPGRWKAAVESSSALQQLLKLDSTLRSNQPPRVVTSNAAESAADTGTRWMHHSGRNRLGYWNLQTVVSKLYEYVDSYKEKHNRPSVWMPRPSELAKEGRDDLRQAMHRFGGTRIICRTSGMIPFQEWFFFEGQLELLVELKRYLDEFASGDYKTFPKVSDIKRNGYDQLHSLIQYYGGRKFLAARLSMSVSEQSSGQADRYSNRGHGDATMLKFGHFDLEFAIRLLTFVREDQMKRQPPLRNPVLSMPSRFKIETVAPDGPWLCTKIDEYGGDENVARRLGLALFATDASHASVGTDIS